MKEPMITTIAQANKEELLTFKMEDAKRTSCGLS